LRSSPTSAYIAGARFHLLIWSHAQVCEVFLCAAATAASPLTAEYTEVELGPGGHFIALRFCGERNLVTDEVELEEVEVGRYSCAPAAADNEGAAAVAAAVETASPTGVLPEAGERRWRGSCLVPWAALPDGPLVANAYAIHGAGESRTHLCCFPVPGHQPNFHQAGSMRWRVVNSH